MSVCGKLGPRGPGLGKAIEEGRQSAPASGSLTLPPLATAIASPEAMLPASPPHFGLTDPTPFASKSPLNAPSQFARVHTLLSGYAHHQNLA